MASLLQKFLIRARRNGLSVPVLALGAAVLLGISAALSGVEGVLFTCALGMAFLLGTASRDGTFHLRSLASAVPRPLDRATLVAQMALADELPRAEGQALCVVMQIDAFDELQGRVGQRGIGQVGAQIRDRLFADMRHSDILADLGEGRFAVYLAHSPRIGLESAIQTALRLQGTTRRPVHLDGLRLHLTASLGFCVTARLNAGSGNAALLGAAETALQVALRDAPRAIRAYDHSLQHHHAASPKVSTGQDIAAALERGEILPWYQPQICTDTGALTGLEALARWQLPDGTTLSPGHFLKDLQGQGLARHLTDRMVAAAIEQIARWDRAGIVVPRISVNLGAEDLADPTLADRIGWALDRQSLAPGRLGLEVLETVVADADPDAMVSRNLLALGALGCHIDLDDFGTGSASINGIRRFGVHRIKVDRSLVTAVDTDPDQHAMIAAILTMAQQLGVDVLAEGVETPGEFSALSQLGCRHAQGFAIARPMPGPDLLAWLLRRGDGQTPEHPGGIAAKAAETLVRDTVRGRLGGKTA